MSTYLSAAQVDQLLPKIIWTQTDCWEWNGAHTTAGYGLYRSEYLHRLMYVRYHGPIPEGLEIDHLCRNRGCCNPLHLEAVTHAENMRRGYFGSKTHCPRGHAYDDENTRINNANGGRECRACIRSRKREAYRATNPEIKTQAARTHCPQGHPYDESNTLWLKPQTPTGSPRRGCRECKRVSSLAAYYRKQAQR